MSKSIRRTIQVATLALLAMNLPVKPAMAQTATSSLNGIWLNSATFAEGGLDFLTIIHLPESKQLAVVSTNLTELFGAELLLSAASLGEADPAALGEDVGTAVSIASLFQGMELEFALHRPSNDELLVELVSCNDTIPDDLVLCSAIELRFPLNEGVHHEKIF